MSLKNTTLKTPSVLAFEKKLCNSDGLMYAGLWSDKDSSNWSELHLQHKDIRGTISNRLKNSSTSDPLKLDGEIQKANLQSVDIVSLPFIADTLKLLYTLRVLGNVGLPSACNAPEYQAALNNKIKTYFDETNGSELALRYAQNIANGRVLWRNRLSADAINIRVNLIEENQIKRTWIFDGFKHSTANFSAEENNEIKELAEEIRKGLTSQSAPFFKIETFARVGQGQEVYPSQELVKDLGNEKYRKSKVLYAVNTVAAMHSQKIGNALRTIDTWYPDMEGPIAIEPYGSVTSRGRAYRQPNKKIDFFTLLDQWVLKNEDIPVEQQHYVVACLIRGGVFGEKE